ncbi:hypothetical protein WJX73_007653 [Symbiochloris irregularis]|uniref:Uncharacterized protein n=1 Tax=Symbiochloris irregularis TaxID=706552 RepID=A0AAW1PI16_9CHLO
MQALTRARATGLLLKSARDGVRRMSGGLSHQEEVAQMNKWRIVTIAAVPVCFAMAVWDLSQGEHEEHEKPDYSYLNIRSKSFPWGDCSLFDTHCGKEEAEE